jgi:AcrR family transcriptional regulator
MSDPLPKRRGRPPTGRREAILDAAHALIAERGAARVTTREVAARARVSEASVYYHYGDRAGLLQAVFEAGLRPLQALASESPVAPAGDPAGELLTYARAIERFLEQALPIMIAAGSDSALRERLADYMDANDLGPHRGVRFLAGWLANLQAHGSVDRRLDPEGAAALLLGACFLRAAQEHLTGNPPDRGLPSLERVVASFVRMLEPDDPAR